MAQALVDVVGSALIGAVVTWLLGLDPWTGAVGGVLGRVIWLWRTS